MGFEHHAYIGPYLRVTETVQQVRQDQCVDHNRPDNAKFCPVCGEANRYKVVEDNGAPDDWGYGYKRKSEEKPTNGGLFDYLCTTSTSCSCRPNLIDKDGKKVRTYLHVPNRFYEDLGIPQIKGGKYSEEEVAFEDLNVSDSKEKFAEIFQEEIEYLKQWFEVELKFGYISWNS